MFVRLGLAELFNLTIHAGLIPAQRLCNLAHLIFQPVLDFWTTARVNLSRQ